MIKRKNSLQKELILLKKQEQRYLDKRQEQSDSRLNRFLEDKIPEKLQNTLEKAFSSAFKLIFIKGVQVIEKTYKKEELEKDFQIRDFANQLKGDRKSLKIMRRQAGSTGTANTLASGAAGIGMGLVGAGLPDIPVFTGFLFRSIYQTALKYGCSYDTEEEKKWILLLIQGASAHGEEQKRANEKIDAYMEDVHALDDFTLDEVIEAAAGVLSRELLYMKFLQGIPVVGIVGGACDLKYMKEITTYSEIKYRKRYYKSFSGYDTI